MATINDRIKAIDIDTEPLVIKSMSAKVKVCRKGSRHIVVNTKIFGNDTLIKDIEEVKEIPNDVRGRREIRKYNRKHSNDVKEAVTKCFSVDSFNEKLFKQFNLDRVNFEVKNKLTLDWIETK